MKTALKVILFVFLTVIVVMFFFGGPVIKNAVNKTAPIALGVPVSIGDVQLYPVRGIVKFTDLAIGNPEGFKTDNLFTMKELYFHFKVSSLFTQKIIVHEISVVGPEITYEATMSGSNVGALQKKLEGAEEKKSEEKAEASKSAEEKPGKKIIIEKFVLNEGRINLSVPGMMGTAMPIPLPSIEMKDIGKENNQDGASRKEVRKTIFDAIFSSVISVATSSGKLVGEGAKKIGEGAALISGAAVDAVGDVGGAAVGAGKAVGKGVAGAVGSVVGIFGGSEEKEEAEKKEESSETENAIAE